MNNLDINIKRLFKKLGIKKNDNLMMHGDSGVIEQLNHNKKFDFFFNKIENHIGKGGTILVPSFSYSFCKNRKFDLKNNPSEVGMFSEKFRLRKNIKRTEHPIFSFSIFGKNWKIYNNANLKTCFGKGSVFDIFHNLNGKIITFGTTFENSATFLHYIEQSAMVHYRFNKKFTGKIINGKKIKKIETNFYVRKRKFNKEFKKPPPYKHILKKCEFGRYFVYSIDAKKLFDFCIKKMKKNDDFLVN